MEDPVDILALFGRRFQKAHVVLLSERFADVIGYLALFAQIALVAHEHDDCLFVNVLLELAQPVGQAIKRRLIAHVINNYDGIRTSIIGLSDCAKTLLTSYLVS